MLETLVGSSSKCNRTLDTARLAYRHQTHAGMGRCAGYTTKMLLLRHL